MPSAVPATAYEPEAFAENLARHGCELRPSRLEVFQLNIGRLCNQSCRHCHVAAGPERADECMTRETIDACLEALDRSDAHTVDITGGAPELHADFRYLIEQARARGKHTIDRCNLTVLLEPGLADLPGFLAAHGVEVVASLPHYRRRSTDAQRGDGVFDQSIEGLHRLNEAGYGVGDSERVLTLMTNPAGAFLAGSQPSMEREWKAALERDHGVTFDRLIALHNIPIGRFRDWLIASGNAERHMGLLRDAFNPATVERLMCRHTLSVSWDGRLFDCDFNQMLDLEASVPSPHVRDFGPDAFARRPIRTGEHCFGCTAGAGSSCGGALVD